MDNVDKVITARRPFVGAPLVWETPRELMAGKLIEENAVLRTRIAFLEAQWAAQWEENNK